MRPVRTFFTSACFSSAEELEKDSASSCEGERSFSMSMAFWVLLIQRTDNVLPACNGTISVVLSAHRRNTP